MEYLGDLKSVNKTSPLVSVCIPTFQHKEYISQCLDSVISQKTDFPFEILIGEDFSTDGTREICMDYAEKYPNLIRLFLRDGKNKLIRSGRITGRYNHLGLYQSARGKYICIIDGDDYWLSNEKLAHESSILEKYPEASMCITQTQIEGARKQQPADGFKVFDPKDLKLTFYMGHISGWMMRNRMNEFIANPISMKAPVLDSTLFNFYKQKGKVVFSPLLTSFYRKNPNGSYSSNSLMGNQKDRFYLSWYFFLYTHKSPYIFFRSLLFILKRYFVSLRQSKNR